MMPVIMDLKVGSDGVLSVALSPGAAGQRVRVTIEPEAPMPTVTQEEWQAWVLSMAGTWQGHFKRMPLAATDE